MTTPAEAIAQRLTEAIAERQDKLIRRLQWLGNKCVKEARTSGNYTDRTGNLRSSIGYVVLCDGYPVTSPKGFRGKGDGAKEGEEALSRAISDAPQQGCVLIVVAGMHYAHYVAALGYDVLDSAEVLAKREVPKILDKLKAKWRKKK